MKKKECHCMVVHVIDKEEVEKAWGMVTRSLKNNDAMGVFITMMALYEPCPARPGTVTAAVSEAAA